MTAPTATHASPDGMGDLPIQPTGSGVADLEVAYEQMKVAQEAESGDAPASDPTSDRSASASVGNVADPSAGNSD